MFRDNARQSFNRTFQLHHLRQQIAELALIWRKQPDIRTFAASQRGSSDSRKAVCSNLRRNLFSFHNPLLHPRRHAVVRLTDATPNEVDIAAPDG